MMKKTLNTSPNSVLYDFQDYDLAGLATSNGKAKEYLLAYEWEVGDVFATIDHDFVDSVYLYGDDSHVPDPVVEVQVSSSSSISLNEIMTEQADHSLDPLEEVVTTLDMETPLEAIEAALGAKTSLNSDTDGLLIEESTSVEFGPLAFSSSGADGDIPKAAIGPGLMDQFDVRFTYLDNYTHGFNERLIGYEPLLNSLRMAEGLAPLVDSLQTEDNLLYWNDQPPTGGFEDGQKFEITYTFDFASWPAGVEILYPEIFSNTSFSAMTGFMDHIASILTAMATWESVANVKFVEFTDPLDVNEIEVNIIENPGSIDAAAFISDIGNNDAIPDLFIRVFDTSPGIGFYNPTAFDGNSLTDPEDPLQGGWALESGNLGIQEDLAGDLLDIVTLHELGHVMFVHHPDTWFSQPNEFDNSAYTIQSIGNGIIAGITTAESGLGVLDILSVQYLYGQNRDFASGDDLYEFDGVATNEQNVGGNQAVHDRITIWDGDGTDTFDSTSYAGDSEGNLDVKIDLREGIDFYSHIGEQIIFLVPSFEFDTRATFEQPDGSYTTEVVRTVTGGGSNIENAIAGAGNDLIFGNHLANTLIAGAGDDVIDGGGDADIIMGGTGNNTASYLTSNQGVHVDLNLVIQNDIGTDAHGDQLIDIQNLEGSHHNDLLHGDANNNVLSGNGGNDVMYGGDGDDELFGGDGDDVLDGGKGDNLIDGGAGFDMVSFRSSEMKVIINLNNAVLTIPGESGLNTYTLVGIEGVVGTSTADQLIGNDEDNIIEGGAGKDKITGNGGENTLSYRFSDEAVQVNLDAGTFVGGDAEGDKVQDLENFYHLIGSENADTLTGDAKDNVIEGRGGADMMDGGDGTDTASYRNSSTAVTVDLSNSANNMGMHAVGDTYANIENIMGSLLYDDYLVGDGLANDIHGLGGNDYLVGGDGNDILRGGLGSDILEGGMGADIIYGGNDATSGDQLPANGVWNLLMIDDSIFGGPLKLDSWTLTLTNSNLDVFTFTSDLINNGEPFDRISINSSIDVSGVTGDLINVAITLHGLETLEGSLGGFEGQRSFSDIDLFLTNSAGVNTEVITDVYSGLSMNNNDITIDDINGVITPPADNSTPPIPSDTYKTRDGDALPSLQSLLVVGDTIGDWTLKIEDTDLRGNLVIGSITGWTIEVVTDAGTFSANGSGFDIANSTVTSSMASLAGIMGTTIENIKVTVAGLTHEVVQELVVTVVAPNSSEAELFKLIGGSNPASAQTDLTVVFDDINGELPFGNAVSLGDPITSESGESLLGLITAISDTVTYENSSASVQIDLSNELQYSPGTEADGDRLIGIENVTGANVAGLGDHLTGDNKGNVLSGLDGDDTILGLDGRDTLIGGAGDDILDGGADDDIYEGGEGADTFQMAIGGGFLAINDGDLLIRDFDVSEDDILGLDTANVFPAVVPLTPAKLDHQDLIFGFLDIGPEVLINDVDRDLLHDDTVISFQGGGELTLLDFFLVGEVVAKDGDLSDVEVTFYGAGGVEKDIVLLEDLDQFAEATVGTYIGPDGIFFTALDAVGALEIV